MAFTKKTIKSLVKSGNIKRLKAVLSDQNLEQKDEEGFTPLYHAVKNGQSRAAKLLLERGASIIVSEDEQFSLMDMLARSCNENLWRVFIEQGYQLPEFIDGEPILHWLLCQKYYAKELLDLLLATDIDINSLNKRGMTALAYMLGRESFSMKALDHILAAGIDVNHASEGAKTPLIVALENRNLPCRPILSDYCFPGVLKRLLEHGLDLETRKQLFTGASISPALSAMQASKPSRFNALFQAGIVLTDSDIEKLKGYLSTHYFKDLERSELIRINESRGEILTLPLDFYDKATLWKKLNTPSDSSDFSIESVRQIVMSGSFTAKEKINLISPLLERGIDLNQTITHAMTEMTLLCALSGWSDTIQEAQELIQWLLEQGARVEANGYSALLYAVWTNKPDLVELFAAREADLDFIDANGMGFESMLLTPSLRGGMFSTNEEVVEMLALIASLYKKAGTSFPVDRMVLCGQSIRGLTINRQFISTIVLFTGEYQRQLLKLYVENGWDINKKFDLSYDEGKLIHLSFIDHMLKSKGRTEEEILYYLRTYPQIRCGTSDDSSSDSLNMAMNYCYSPYIIGEIIARTENINRSFKRDMNDEVFTSRKENYLALAIAYGQARKDAVKVEETTAIINALIEAGCDLHFIVECGLSEGYRGSGLYRSELSLLECVMDMWANNMDALPFIEILLDHGAPVHTRLGRFEEGFIHKICGRIGVEYNPFVIEVLKMLEARGLLELEEKSNNGATALLHAASKANVQLCRWLIERGADVMAIGGFDQSTALNRAITNFSYRNKQDRLDTVRLLLDAGADINYIDSDGFSPLMCAVYTGCYDIAKELIERGADLNPVHAENQQTLMHLAIDTRHAYDLSENNRSYTKLESYELRRQIISLLIENGVDIDAPQEGGTSPLCQSIATGDVEMFKILSKCGADSNRSDGYGRTAAMIACMRGGLGFVNTIFGRKKTAEVILNRDSQGMNVIHYAARRDVDERDDMLAKSFIKRFVEQLKVPLLSDFQGTSPLHYACLSCKRETAELLLDLGCGIGELDELGNTPLHYASQIAYETEIEKRRTLIQMLLDQGADAGVKNSQGYTAADYIRSFLDDIENTQELNDLIELLGGNTPKIGF